MSFFSLFLFFNFVIILTRNIILFHKRNNNIRELIHIQDFNSLRLNAREFFVHAITVRIFTKSKYLFFFFKKKSFIWVVEEEKKAIFCRTSFLILRN